MKIEITNWYRRAWEGFVSVGERPYSNTYELSLGQILIGVVSLPVVLIGATILTIFSLRIKI